MRESASAFGSARYAVTAKLGAGWLGEMHLTPDCHRTLRTAGVLVIMALGVSNCAVHAQVTEPQGQILFDSGDAQVMDMQLYVMDPDGTHLRQVTETPPGTGSAIAVWSPDRQKIAVGSNRDGDHEVYVMDADGSNVQRLTTYRGFDGLPAWSPDSSRIAFIRDPDPPATGPLFPAQQSSIYVMDADGSNVERLTDFAIGGYISWSPDGQRIAFAANREGTWEIYVMDTDGSNVQRLAHAPDENAFAPAWSPDGQQIAFDSTRDGNFEVYVMDADGSNVKRLTHHDKSDARPAWSPDGHRIVFHSSRDGSSDQPEVYPEFEIYVMDADGGNVQRLTYNDHFDGHPDWR